MVKPKAVDDEPALMPSNVEPFMMGSGGDSPIFIVRGSEAATPHPEG